MADHTEDIGYLKGKAENTENQLKNLYDKNDHQTQMIGQLHTATQEIKLLLTTHAENSNQKHNDLENKVDHMEEDVMYCKENIQEINTVKKTAKWAIPTLTAVWAGVMTALKELKDWVI